MVVALCTRLVKIGFQEGVGDVSDTYLLWINSKTSRVDQFLLTVLDFGKKEPLLMKVQYERINGVLLPTNRRCAPSSWSGSVPADAKWIDEISVGIRFGDDFGQGLISSAMTSV